jgi:hypothetical protein
MNLPRLHQLADHLADACRREIASRNTVAHDWQLILRQIREEEVDWDRVLEGEKS